MDLKSTFFPINKRFRFPKGCSSCIYQYLQFIICITTCICIHNTQGKVWEYIGCQTSFIWKCIFEKSNEFITKSSLNSCINKDLNLHYSDTSFWLTFTLKFHEKMSLIFPWKRMFARSFCQRHTKSQHYMQNFWLAPFLNPCTLIKGSSFLRLGLSSSKHNFLCFFSSK